jgi:uncharacterized protein DUF4153
MSEQSACVSTAGSKAAEAKTRTKRDVPLPTPAHIVLASSLVILADYLFFGQRLGWTAGLFAGSLLMAMVVLNVRLIARRAGFVLFILLAGLCLGMVEEPTDLSIGLFVLGLAALALADEPRLVASAGLWLMGALHFLLTFFFRLPLDFIEMPSWSRGHGAFQWLLRAAQVWIPSLCFAGGFLLLFALGNPIIANSLEPLQFVENLELPSSSRIWFWVIFLCGTWCFLRAVAFSGEKEQNKPAQSAKPNNEQQNTFLTQEIIVRSMALCNAVFALQNSLDLQYLWAGASLPEGLTYASYVHSGTFTLTVAALLAACFVLLAFPSRTTRQPSHWAYVLMYLWVAQSVLLVIFAMQRMGIYIDAYALSYLRVVGLMGMGLVAIGLMLIVARIALLKSSRWLFNANAIAFFSVLYVSCFVDFGRIIADYNVSRCGKAGGQTTIVDVNYLLRLGPSALPALKKLKWPSKCERVTRWDKNSFEARLAHRVESLTDDIKSRRADWRAWTFRGHRLVQELGLH